MHKLVKRLKELYLSYDRIGAYLCILLVIFLVLYFLYPGQVYFLIGAFATGGLINVVSGLKVLKDKKKQNLGISYIFFGILIILIGFLTIRLFMAE